MSKIHIQPPVNWWSLLATVKQRPAVGPVAGAGSASQHDCEGSSWAGASWKEALAMMTNGWEEGTRRVSTLLDTVTEANCMAAGWQLEAAGCFPSVPAFLSGDPECMWARAEVETRKPRVCLIVPTVYPHSITADRVMCYGAAVAAVVRALETAGVDAAIYSVDRTRSRHPGDAVIQPYVVREFGQPLDLGIVAFAFHPAFLRRIVFAWRELNEVAAKAGIANYGYGIADEPKEDECRKALGDFGAETVILPSVETLEQRGLLSDHRLGELVEHLRGVVEHAAKASRE